MTVFNSMELTLSLITTRAINWHLYCLATIQFAVVHCLLIQILFVLHQCSSNTSILLVQLLYFNELSMGWWHRIYGLQNSSMTAVYVYQVRTCMENGPRQLRWTVMAGWLADLRSQCSYSRFRDNKMSRYSRTRVLYNTIYIHNAMRTYRLSLIHI